MKRLILGSLLISALVQASPLSVVRSSIVKVVSGMTGTATEFRGSGIVFEREGKRYVLTSDHVVVHMKGGLSHNEAKSSVTGESLKLKYLASEWTKGLALLEVESGSTSPVIAYADLFEKSSAKVGDYGVLYGYPFESSELTEESEAELLNHASPMPYYLQAPKLVEFDAIIGEFGMSGGGAFSEEGHFLGVLAYQKLLLGNHPSNRIFAVPQSVITEWLEGYFANPSAFLPLLDEPWWAQGQDQTFVTNHNYFFAFRAFKGVLRFLASRAEALLVLKVGPTQTYDDSKGLISRVRKYLDPEPMRPSEFGILDRSKGPAILRKFVYPAEVFEAIEEAGTSILIFRGKRHEERYATYRPVVDAVISQVRQLQSKMQPIKAEDWKALSTSLDGFINSLESIPPKPTLPDPQGAGEFFHIDFVAGVYIHIESLIQSAGWPLAVKHSAGEAKALRESLEKLPTALDALEIR